MTDRETILRSRIARQVKFLWGNKRTEANAGVIESAAQALARLDEMRPDATARLDDDEETSSA